MNAVQLMFGLMEETGHTKADMCRLMGLSRPRMTDLSKQSDATASQVCRFLDALGYSLVAVPTSHVRAGSLPRGSAVVDEWEEVGR